MRPNYLLPEGLVKYFFHYKWDILQNLFCRGIIMNVKWLLLVLVVVNVSIYQNSSQFCDTNAYCNRLQEKHEAANIQCSIQYLNINNQCKILNYILTRYNWLEWGVVRHPSRPSLMPQCMQRGNVKSVVIISVIIHQALGGGGCEVWDVVSPHQDPPTLHTEPALARSLSLSSLHREIIISPDYHF